MEGRKGGKGRKKKKKKKVKFGKKKKTKLVEGEEDCSSEEGKRGKGRSERSG